jgi:hypothetical protein
MGAGEMGRDGRPASGFYTGVESQRQPHVWDYAPLLRDACSFAHRASRTRPGAMGN